VTGGRAPAAPPFPAPTFSDTSAVSGPIATSVPHVATARGDDRPIYTPISPGFGAEFGAWRPI